MEVLGQLFRGLSRNQFFASHWEQKELYVKKAVIPQELISLEEFQSILNAQAKNLNGSIVRLIQNGNVIPEGQYTKFHNQRRVGQARRLDNHKFQKLCDKGCTIAFTGLECYSDKLHTYCKTLSRELKESTQINGYLSQKGIQGFDPHYDHHEIFIIQIDGEKEWTIFGKPEMFPLPTETHYFQGRPDLKKKRKFVLQPGDSLYLPRGLWHEAKATRKSSLHLTLNIKCHLYSDFMIWLIQQLAREKVAYRKNLQRFTGKPSGLSELIKDLRALNPNLKQLIRLYYTEHLATDDITLPFKR